MEMSPEAERASADVIGPWTHQRQSEEGATSPAKCGVHQAPPVEVPLGRLLRDKLGGGRHYTFSTARNPGLCDRIFRSMHR